MFITNEEARKELGLPLITDVQQSSLNDAINALSPLVANNVLSNMTINEKRQLANLPPIAGGDSLPSAAPVALSKQNPFGWDDERDLVVFNKYGEKAEEFEEAKFEFADAIESAILNVLKENKGLQVGDIVNITKLDAKVVADAIANTFSKIKVCVLQGTLFECKEVTCVGAGKAQLIIAIQNVINPTVIDAGENIKVPIIYGNPEKWYAAKSQGALRDQQGKLQIPLIMVKRTSFSKDEGYQTFNRYLSYPVMTKFNEKNKYDKFSLLNKTVAPTNQIFAVTMPDHIKAEYEFIVWTEYVEQNNAILEM